MADKPVKEIKNKLENYSTSERMEMFAKAIKRLQLTNLAETDKMTFTAFSKDKLRTYMKDPLSNANSLRQLSRFLYRRSFPYRRLIQYNAEMIDLNCQSIIPLIDMTKENDKDKILKSYYNTCSKIEQMNLASEIFKLLTVAWREDTAFGYVYDDGETFFIHILDGDYCKVSSIEDGVLNFAFDFSYFNSTNHSDYLDYWGSEFSKKYTSYQNDKRNKRWQELDVENTICLKVNIDDPLLPFPPFGSLFEQLIDLVDLQNIQSVKDEMSIYKILVAYLDTLTSTNEPDDFSVDPDTAIEYYEKLEDGLPEYVASCISPLKIDTIDFQETDTSDVDMISNATSNLFKLSGGSQVLNSEQITGTSAYEAAILCDTELAISSLLPQIEKWINRYLTFKLGKDHARIKYFEVSTHTKSKKKKELLESGQNGIPVKLAIAALDGFTPLETMSLEFLENDILELHKSWIPLSTSYTQSGNPALDDGDGNAIDGGRPQSDELTDEGEKSRENG